MEDLTVAKQRALIHQMFKFQEKKERREREKVDQSLITQSKEVPFDNNKGVTSCTRSGGLGGENDFLRPDRGPFCCMKTRDLVPCVAAAPAMAKKGPGIAQAVASEGASPKSW
ncbi:hypothetical protein AAY473_014972 [Plecturocebus cupreus]